MKTRLFISLLVMFVMACGHKGPRLYEKTEWCDLWVSHANLNDLPRILFIGDSITRGYFPLVEDSLQGQAYCARLATSKSLGNPLLLQEIELVLKHYQFNIIQFNNGLHQFNYTDEQYALDFSKIFHLVRKFAKNAQLIWASTTPMRMKENLDQIHPTTQRIIHRNSSAKVFFEAKDIPINDLFAVVMDRPEYYWADGIHFNDQGKAALAKQVVDFIRPYLSRMAKTMEYKTWIDENF